MSGPADRRAPFSPAWRDAPTFVATFGGIGLIPGAPGTWGSLAALPVAWAVLDRLGPWALAAAAVAVFMLGWWAAARVAQDSGIDDPSPVVIDEVAGQFVALVPATADLWEFALGFALFRLADIAKPWPASWADRRLKGGLGVMADDIAAGVYAAAGLLIVGEALA